MSSTGPALHGPPPDSPRLPLGNAVVTSAAALALLYFGREVLIPITLAVILSFVVASSARALQRIGLGRVPAMLVAGAGLVVFLFALATMIASQLAQMVSSIPQYEATIQAKAKALHGMTIGRIESVLGEAGRVMAPFAGQNADLPEGRTGGPRALAPSTKAVPVEIQEGLPGPLKFMSQILSSLWGLLETAGIVLVVLTFLLLEHEAVRDRFIRLAGGKDLQATTVAISDAGERLSRYFASQFAVNFGVGAAILLGLAGIGLPHATLWGTLTAVLRFVPYVGVPIAALSAGLFAAAVDQGWSLTVTTLGLYFIVEMIAVQVVEPQLYGHRTGLSPLSVIIAAIFWSWLWGPVGLVVAIPLTVCLVVAGRHVKALEFLDILLGDAPALTMPQRFYQRALSGDSDEIIAAARVFLKRRSFATYCDSVLLRALQLAHADVVRGAITDEQLLKAGSTVVAVIEALGSETGRRSWGRRPSSVLDDPNLGRYLRRQRELVSGRWQGPLATPPGSVVLAIGLGSLEDDLVTEILVRILRALRIDARHLSIEDLEAPPPPGATPASVSMVCIVSAHFERERCAKVAAEVRRRLPEASIASLLLSEHMPPPEPITALSKVDFVASSFEAAAQHVIARLAK